MKSRDYAHLSLLILAAIIIRALIFDDIAIWGDMGFYVADTTKILAGERPFFDFLGRSPLFLYGFAAARTVFGHPVHLVRAYVVFWWILTIIPVYGLARHIHSHKAGILAGAFFAFSPFTLFYGMWANTQSLAAFLAGFGVLAYLRLEGLQGATAAGALFGLAFLSRRSVIVILPAIPLWLAIQSYQSNTRPRAILAGSLSLFASFAGILMVGYYFLSPSGLSGAIDLAHTHAVSLFISNGRGGYPLIGANPPPVVNELEYGYIPIFHDICQLCTFKTAITYFKTLLRASSLLVPLGVYYRDLDHRFIDPNYRIYLHGILIVLAGYGAVTAATGGYVWRTVVVVSVLLAFYGIYKLPRVDSATLWNPGMLLVLVVLFGYAAGYLYRNRVLHVYYFMDLAPFVAVVSGILIVALSKQAELPAVGVSNVRSPQFGVAVVMVLLLVSGAAMTHPGAINPVNDEQHGWYTFDNIDEYNEFWNTHTEQDEEVFAQKISYVAASHATLPNAQPRTHYLIATFENNGPGEEMFQYLLDGTESGRFKYLVMTQINNKTITWYPELERAVEANYCLVQDEKTQALFAQTNGELWIHQSYVDGDCERGEVASPTSS